MKDFMLKKKKGEGMDPLDKEAKTAAICEMKKMAEDAMSEKLGSLKKVTVAAPDEESLKQGLEKAEDIVEGKMETEEAPEMESESEDSEITDMSEEELDKKIQELMALKSKLKV